MKHPKRKMDWDGLIVDNQKTLENKHVRFDPGTQFIVKYWSKGLALMSEPCDCCGACHHITRVQPNDINLLSTDYNRERLEWNQARTIQRRGIYNETFIADPDTEKPTPPFS